VNDNLGEACAALDQVATTAFAKALERRLQR
jgi:hypothetical protein